MDLRLLTDIELEAANILRAAMERTGASPHDLLTPSPAALTTPLPLTPQPPPVDLPVLNTRAIHPTTARPFSLLEISAGGHKLTRQTNATKIARHPVEAVVEYPETGEAINDVIFHQFCIDPNNTIHPHDNIQYSLGGSKSTGMHYNRTCNWLTPTGNPEAEGNAKVACTEIIYTCKI